MTYTFKQPVRPPSRFSLSAAPTVTLRTATSSAARICPDTYCFYFHPASANVYPTHHRQHRTTATAEAGPVKPGTRLQRAVCLSSESIVLDESSCVRCFFSFCVLRVEVISQRAQQRSPGQRAFATATIARRTKTRATSSSSPSSFANQQYTLDSPRHGLDEAQRMRKSEVGKS